MCLMHNLQPLLYTRLGRRDNLSHAWHKNLGTSTRERVKACSDKSLEGRLSIKTANFGYMCHLRSTKGVETQSRIAMFKLAEELLIELNAQLGMHTTLQQQLVSAKLIEAVNLCAILVYGGYKVLISLVWLAVKVTEQTARGADISCVDITVYLPSNNIRVRHTIAPQNISLLGKLLKWSGAIEQPRLLLA